MPLRRRAPSVTSQRRKEVKEQLTGKLSQQTYPTPPMMSELTMSELNDAISRLKNKKAPGKDGVSNEMIKHLGPAAKTKLLEIFNLSWKTGVFPPAWKEAIMIPIPKKNKNPKKKTNYRPINLLSCLGKTLERMINQQPDHQRTDGLKEEQKY